MRIEKNHVCTWICQVQPLIDRWCYGNWSIIVLATTNFIDIFHLSRKPTWFVLCPRFQFVKLVLKKHRFSAGRIHLIIGDPVLLIFTRLSLGLFSFRVLRRNAFLTFVMRPLVVLCTNTQRFCTNLNRLVQKRTLKWLPMKIVLITGRVSRAYT